MSDPTMVGLWAAVLIGGVIGCVGLRALGLASTHVRDLLHVGAGVWIVGWPLWRDPLAPTLLVVAVAVATALVPSLARHNRWIDRFRRSVAEGDERYAGLIWYTWAYAVLTVVGLHGAAFPAAAALLALSLGDGIGGAVGRRFGRRLYRHPGGKTKSLEGSFTVFAAATAGAAIAASITGAGLGPNVFFLGAVATIAEAWSPRGADNAIVPAAVFAAAHLM